MYKNVRVECISDYNEDYLNKNINNWLEENKDKDIIDIKFSIAAAEGESRMYDLFGVLIIYKIYC